MQSLRLRALRKTSLASSYNAIRCFSIKKRLTQGNPDPPIEPLPSQLTPEEIRRDLQELNIIDSRPAKPIIKEVRPLPDDPELPPKRLLKRVKIKSELDVLNAKADSVKPVLRFENIEAALQETEQGSSNKGDGGFPKRKKYGSEGDEQYENEIEMWESRIRADPRPIIPDFRITHIEDDTQQTVDRMEPYVNLRISGDGGGVALKQKFEKMMDEMEEIHKKGGATPGDQFMKYADALRYQVWDDEVPDGEILLNEHFPLHDQEGHPLQFAEREIVMEQFKKEFYEETEFPRVSPVYVSEEKRKKYDEVEDYHMLQKYLQRADHTFFNPPDEQAYFNSHDPPERPGKKEEEGYVEEQRLKKQFPIYDYTCLLWQKSRTRKYETGFKQKHTCMIVAGNGKGVGGFGIGKAQTAEEAFEAAVFNIEKNLFFVPLFEGRTLPQPVVGQMNETKVIVTPMRRGAGLKGADYIHEVFRCWGITDCNVKIIGGKNRYSLMYALWDALARQTTLRSEAIRRGVNYHRVFMGGQDGDFESPKRWKYPSREWVAERQMRLDRIFAHAWRIYEERSDDINKEILTETVAEKTKRLTGNFDRYLTPVSNKKPYHQLHQ